MRQLRGVTVLLALLALLLLPVLVQAQETINYGDRVEGSLSEDQARASYVFEGTAGDEVMISLTSEEFDAYVSLMDAGGEMLAEDDDGGDGFNAELTFTLPESASYTIIATSLREYLSEGSFFAAGDYTLSLELISEGEASEGETEDAETEDMEGEEETDTEEAPTEDDEIVTDDEIVAEDEESAAEMVIELGETVSGELSSETPSQSYTFEANAGDLVTITVISDEPGKFDTYLLLLDSEGVELMTDDDSAGNLNSRIGPYDIPEDGTYTIVVDSFGNIAGDEPGVGAFELTVVAAMIEVIEYNTPVEGAITTDEPVTMFGFEGAAGDVVTVMLSGDTSALSATISQTSGDFSRQTYGETDVLGPFVLPEDGEYAVTITSYDGMTDQAFTLVIEQAEAEMISIGDEVSGTFGEAAVRYYSFEARAGDVIDVSVNSASMVDTQVSITGPNGLELAYDDDGGFGFDPEIEELLLPETGTYNLLVTPYIPGDDGEFMLSITDNALASLENVVQVVRLSDKNEEGVVVFEGLAGERVRLTVNVIAGAENEPRIRVMQGETMLASQTIGTLEELSIVFTVEETGPVQVFVSDDFFGNAVLEFSLSRLGR